MNKKQFINELEKIGVKLSEKQLEQLHIYYEMLVEWNKVMNLTGITEEEQVYLKHFYDSLTICKVVDLNKELTLCDIGTGAGFPGMVLKICFPHLHVTLVDSLGKRLNFLDNVINKLELIDIETIHARAEEYAIKVREKYDVVTARAVASLNTLLEYCIPLIRPGKYFVAMKGNIAQEIKLIDACKKLLDTKLLKMEEFMLPIEGSIRNILVFSKLGNTNKKYPRKYSEIKKNPL